MTKTNWKPCIYVREVNETIISTIQITHVKTSIDFNHGLANYHFFTAGVSKPHTCMGYLDRVTPSD